MIFHENRLGAEDSHEISCLIWYFCKSSIILNYRLLQIIGGTLRVNTGLTQEAGNHPNMLEKLLTET